MNRRSRGGCIDCRKAKVKCDEIKPHCGTCKRRRHVCQGYNTTASTTQASSPSSRSSSSSISSSKTSSRYNSHRRHSSALKQLSPSIVSIAINTAEAEGPRDDDSNNNEDEDEDPKGRVVLPTQNHHGPMDDDAMCTTNKRPFSRFNEPVTTSYSSITVPKAGHPLIMDPILMTPRALGLIPPGVVSSTDRPTVELYFTRHPYELNISPEFVNEMNTNVLAILQQSPHAIVDSLSAIGHSYLTGSNSNNSSSDPSCHALAVLNYRARILATLRAMQLSEHNLEVMVFMLLGLSAIELVDCQTTAPETTIPAVIANSASLIRHHLSTGREISSLARYFIRALARQDMIISLVCCQRPRIPTSVWLDETAVTTADRLMGYTATLMPLLEELCALAEDVKMLLAQAKNSQQEYEEETENANVVVASDHASWPLTTTTSSYLDPSIFQPAMYNTHNIINNSDMSEIATTPTQLFSPVSCISPSTPSTTPLPPTPTTGPDIFAAYAQRAEDLRLRIETWKPSIAHGLSFRSSRRYLSQAACYRSGALLYLFRLLHPPQPSPHPPSPSPNTIDGEATAKAHEVLLSTTTGADGEVKMLLWPVFLAACEMSAEEDRQMVLDILDAIMVQRRTVTAQRTKGFVLNRVWPARDEGREWNWMVLAREYPGECLPI